MKTSTAMRNAFENIKVKPSAMNDKGIQIGRNIAASLRVGYGQQVIKDELRLTHKTYTKLSAVGAV